MPCALQAAVFARRLHAKRNLFFKTSGSLVLAPTAEEVVLAIPSSCAPSKQYQIQLKFRNEVRPAQALARSFEFTMKDGYILNKNKLEILSQLKAVAKEYISTFKTLDVAIVPVVASASEIGGSHSIEFVVKTSIGANTKFCVPARSLAGAQ